ncbi:MAG: efflux RND transporter periplasmic adaptor subunit [Anaerolineales bacterium]|jgi:HlyD family secretion protein
MKTLIKPFHLILVALIALSIAGCSALGTSQTSAIQASGVIEATRVDVSPESSGRVAQVSVNEGDVVKSGDQLLSLDGSLLQAQRKVAAANLDAARSAQQSAQASLDTAQAQYQAALDAALSANQETRTSAWHGTSSGLTQPAWYFTQAEQIQAAQAELDAAQKNLADKQSKLQNVINSVQNSGFVAAEKRMADARTAYEAAKAVDHRAQSSSNTELRTAAKDAFNDAKDELDRAQQAYNDMLTTQAAKDVLKARAELAVAQERYNTAQDQQRALQTGAMAPQVVAAQKAVQQAQDGLNQAQAGASQAQAQLDLIDAQMAQLSVSAPVDGVVLTRNIQPGEVLQAGMTALVIGEVSHLKVTVYLPEDQYGQVHLGDHASLSVDSYPNESFDALVTRIADQAEYTPNNVQTKQERQTTVYAVELSISNPQGKLIPGMPVDVTFGS